MTFKLNLIVKTVFRLKVHSVTSKQKQLFYVVAFNDFSANFHKIYCAVTSHFVQLQSISSFAQNMTTYNCVANSMMNSLAQGISLSSHCYASILLLLLLLSFI